MAHPESQVVPAPKPTAPPPLVRVPSEFEHVATAGARRLEAERVRAQAQG
jgi:hypothetical protein